LEKQGLSEIRTLLLVQHYRLEKAAENGEWPWMVDFAQLLQPNAENPSGSNHG
jgi:hypothetical protein